MEGKKPMSLLLQGGRPPAQIDEGSIGGFEEDAMRAANAMYSALGEALAAYDALKEKPAGLKAKAARYRLFAEALGKWERKMLMMKGKKGDFLERVRLLGEFTDICRSYEGE